VIYVSFKHLSLEEREKLYLWKGTGVSNREIGRRLNRNHRTIGDELKKNTKYGKEYLPCNAQKRAERIGAKQRYKAPLKGPEVFLYVRQHLRSPFFWTPGVISGRIGIDIQNTSIDTETIYRYIYSRGAREYRLWEYLPCGRKRRMEKGGREVRNNGKVPNAKSIDTRPKIVEKRKQPGHWETDNIEGPRTTKPALSVSTERLFRLNVITKVPNQKAIVKTYALVKGLSKYPPEYLRSMTQDNGKENYRHEVTSKKLGLEMYFCHPYHSWEKGTVENRNKNIRRFFPKGTDFTKVRPKEIQTVEDILNNTPMECLGYLTPYEKMDKYLKRVKTT